MSLLRRRKGRKGKPLEFRQIAPNMVTSGNLICGVCSLVLAAEGRFVPAAWLVFFSVLFDGLDGKVARMLGGGSQFGLEFDSLADLISFGVAPAMLLYHASVRNLGGLFALVPVCFFVLCVALRLARFNVVHVPGYFQGLPSPAGGLFVVSFILAECLFTPEVMTLVLAGTGFLMISSIPYANLKRLTKKSADKVKCLAVLVMVSFIFVFLGAAAPLFLFTLYIVMGLLRFDWGKWLLLQDAQQRETMESR